MKRQSFNFKFKQMRKQQKGALKLRGTHGDFNFAQTQDGFVWREKAKFDKEKFLKNPQIAKTVSEFTRAGKAVKLLRTAFERQMLKAKDSRLTARMQKQVMAVIKEDSIHDWGERTVIDGDPVHLHLFQCNADSIFSAMLGTDYNCSIDRPTGEVLFNVPSFVPKRSMRKPDLATHFRLLTAAAVLDFDANTCITAANETDFMPIDKLPTAPISLSHMLPAGSVLPIYAVAGLEFTKVVNGFPNDLEGNKYNSLCIVKIEHP